VDGVMKHIHTQSGNGENSVKNNVKEGSDIPPPLGPPCKYLTLAQARVI